MVISYTDNDVEKLFNNSEFNNNFLAYKKQNKTKIDKLNIFFSNLDINKNYFKMNISSKNKKFRNNLSNETITLKFINNELNKVTNDNIDNIMLNINEKLIDNKNLLPLIIDSVINKCIFQIQYVNNYIKILNNLLNMSNIDINVIIQKNIDIIYKDNIIIENNYDNLCKINKNIDSSIGLSILIVKLELLNIIQNYTDKTIDKLFCIIFNNINNEDIVYKYIISLFNIFKELDSEYLLKYTEKLNEIKSKNISKKIKFKIMDILEI